MSYKSKFGQAAGGSAVAMLHPRDDHRDTLEPLAEHRQLSVLQQLRERFGADPALLDALLSRWMAVTAPPARLRWINASVGRDVALIDVRAVLYFQSDTEYTRVVTANSEALIRRPLRVLLGELDPASFWPIHRSTIGNVAAIAGITRGANGRAMVTLRSRPERLPVSAAHEHRFRQM